ncbi:uncharacterized protein LOC126841971 [Adelges cooleyi]|uniref:uncharacterized protein LOC126841971 n=1 Tax=Adelges cooleyi TaxID=133065 RepID=UPI00217FB8A4|nr:uncharacterized protein LOC126841971 [Adelges cooleyi]
MGGCCSWCKDEDTYGGIDQERTHLLIDPSCNNTSIQRATEEYHYGSLPKESEEQAGLNRILEEISANVIDVGALHSCIDQQEVLERQNHYNAKLQNLPLSSVANTVVSLRQAPACLLKDIPGPERVLSRNLDLPDNYRDILARVIEIQRLISIMSVEHKGDLVVEF